MRVLVNSRRTLFGFGEGCYENMVIAEGWHCILGDMGVEAGELLCGARLNIHFVLAEFAFWRA